MLSSSPRNLRLIAAAVAVVLLAAAMRILGADHMPFWSDEAWNIWVTRDGTALMLERLAANHHPPAYFLALQGWQQIAGDGKLALRFLSIAAGVLATAVIYRAGADAFGYGVGIAAAVLFAVFEQPVYYGQSVRHYTWLLLGEALTLWALVRALKRPTWGRWAGYAGAVAFLAYSLYVGLIAVALQGLAVLAFWRVPLRLKARPIAAYAAAVLAFAPWLIYALPGVLNKIDAGAITGYINSIPTTPAGITQTADLLTAGQPALGLGLLALALGFAWRGRSRFETLSARIVLAAGVGTVVVMLLVNLRIGIVSERTLSVAVPALALCFAVGAQVLSERGRNVLIAALVAWAVLTPQNVIPRLNSDLVAETVAAGWSPGDFVLLETGFDDMAFAYELETVLPDLDRRIFPTFYEYDYPDDSAMLADLEAALPYEQRVWLVYWNVPPRLAELLQDRFFSLQHTERVPVGINDPLYQYYPEIEVSLFTRERIGRVPRVFGDLFALRDAIIPAQLPAGETLHVDLVWQVLDPPDRDYTVGLFVLDAEGLTRAEHFGPPPENPTSQWPTGEMIFDRHSIDLPADLAPGTYFLLAVVYYYETVDEPLEVEGEPNLVIGTFEVVEP
ncbi:MAG: glycosyltransferase family 39 protein [Chloroflexi bacterium]|nr:glycosyltransferase family 39 protein [Chloroflexota bacterium]